jgi:hypothetical protein
MNIKSSQLLKRVNLTEEKAFARKYRHTAQIKASGYIKCMLQIDLRKSHVD